MAGNGDSPSVAALARLLPGVDRKPVAELCAAARIQTYRGGQQVCKVDEAGHPGVVVTGLLRHVVTLRNGRRATIHYTGPRGVFGMTRLFSQVSTNVEAVRNSDVIKIDPSAVTRVAHEYPQFGWFIAQQVSLAYALLPRVVEELASMSVRQRVASHLIALAVRDGEGNLRVEVSQESLAEAVCSVREVVSRALSSLREEGLITNAGRSLLIVDEHALRQA
jgi:CRP-like cAMP-binding protein